MSEGAPCGVDGCRDRFCSDEDWRDHCKTEHPEYYREELTKFTDKLWLNNNNATEKGEP